MMKERKKKKNLELEIEDSKRNGVEKTEIRKERHRKLYEV